MAELFVLQACVFFIETEENKISFHAEHVDMHSSFPGGTCIFVNCCNEYHEDISQGAMCEERCEYTWTSNLEIKRFHRNKEDGKGEDEKEEEDDDVYISIHTSCLSSSGCQNCTCRWCTTFEERAANGFLPADLFE